MRTSDDQLKLLTALVDQFGLNSLRNVIQACESLSQERILDVAVLGQFKSGKSTLPNTLLGTPVFPVGVLPVTAIITRVTDAPQRQVQITHLYGTVEHSVEGDISGLVTQSGNPGNQKQVRVVDISMHFQDRWKGLRFVDTPGIAECNNKTIRGITVDRTIGVGP